MNNVYSDFFNISYWLIESVRQIVELTIYNSLGNEDYQSKPGTVCYMKAGTT